MVQEDQQRAEAECRASDVQTAESNESTIPLTSKTRLIRSETIDLSSPDKDCTINLGQQAIYNTITLLKTSSPNCNTSPAKRKFGSFGESSHIFNTSEIAESDMTLVNLGAKCTEQSTIVGPGDATIVFQSTMIQEQPKLIDITSNVTPTFQHNPWNMTEVLAPNNVPHQENGGHPEATVVLSSNLMDLMDVDEPDNLIDNSK